MEHKPKIEYVGQFYVLDSLARQEEERREARKAARQQAKKPGKTLYIDPFALGGIILAGVLLVALLVGALQFRSDWKMNTRTKKMLNTLQYNNMQLESAYRRGYDLNQIEAQAKNLGLVPAQEATSIFVTVTMPEPKKERTAWDDFVWFMKGLFAEVDAEDVTEAPTEPVKSGRR